jgi:hypothetical protein
LRTGTTTKMPPIDGGEKGMKGPARRFPASGFFVARAT